MAMSFTVSLERHHTVVLEQIKKTMDCAIMESHIIWVDFHNHLPDNMILEEFARSFQNELIKSLCINFEHVDIIPDDIINSHYFHIYFILVLQPNICGEA